MRQQSEVELFLTMRDLLDGHPQSALAIQGGHNFNDGHTAPLIKKLLVEFTTPLAERLLPGDVVQWHGIGNRAVTIEQVGAEIAPRNLELHVVRKALSFILIEAKTRPRPMDGRIGCR